MKSIALMTALLISLASGSVLAENWAGASVGVTAGGVWHESKGKGASFDDTSPEALAVWAQTNKEETSNRLFAGVKAGYNWQTGDLVYGVIADLNFTSTKKTSGTLDYGWYSYHREDKMNWLSTLRGRVGKDMSGFLPYVTGGLAIADITNVHQTITCCPTLYESNKDNTRYGWTIGAGVEKKIDDAFSVSLEGLYVDFPGKNGETTTTGVPANVYNSRVKLINKAYLLNIGLNYRFK